MTDKETNAAEAWLILNDADAVEKKVLDVLGKAFSDSNADGMNNREMFMSAMTRTETMRGYVTSLTMGIDIKYRRMTLSNAYWNQPR